MESPKFPVILSRRRLELALHGQEILLSGILDGANVRYFDLGNGTRVYSLNGGAYGYIGSSSTAVMSVDELHNLPKSFPPAYGLSFKKDFASSIPVCCSRLAEICEVEESRLDYTVASMREIEKAGKRRFAVEARDDPQFLVPFIAYTGEIYVRNLKGQWFAEYHPAHDVWEPRVLLSSGRLICPCLIVLRELASFNDDSGSVFAQIAADYCYECGETV